MHRGEKQKSENETQIRTTTNSEKNMIVKFRSKTFYMTSAKVLDSRKKKTAEWVTKWKKTGRTSDCNSWNETEWWRELICIFFFTNHFTLRQNFISPFTLSTRPFMHSFIPTCECDFWDVWHRKLHKQIIYCLAQFISVS